MKRSPDQFAGILVILLAVAALAAMPARALSVEAVVTYKLGDPNSGTTIDSDSFVTPAWIAAGTLPTNSFLTSVSINARLDTYGDGDTWASDLAVYVTPAATPPGSSAVLQIGGYDTLGNPVTRLSWGIGDSGDIGTMCVGTMTAGVDFPEAIDLHGNGVVLASGGWATASWSGTVTITYDSATAPTGLTWRGADPTNPTRWSTSSAVLNWTDGTSTVAYADGQHVYFDDSVGAGSKTVEVSDANVAPASVTFDNNTTGAATYILTGAHGITGGAGLTKSGDGTVVVGTVNTYTGATRINAGTLRLGVANAIPHGSASDNVTVAGTLDLNGLSPTLNGLQGGGTITSGVAGTATLTVGDAGRSGTFAGLIEDGNGVVALKKIGGGTLKLSGINTYSGGTTITSGRLLLGLDADSALGTGSVTATGSTIELDRNDISNALALDNAVLTTGNSYSSYWRGPITLLGPATFDVGATGNLIFTGDMGGPGGLTLTGTRWDINGVNHFSGAGAYAGPTKIAGALWEFDNRSSLYNGDTSKWTAENLAVSSNATCIFRVGGATGFTQGDIGILAGLGTGTGGFGDGSFLGLDTSGAGGAFEYAAAIADTNGGANSIGLRLFAAQPLTLSGANTHTGPTQIYTGTVRVSSLNSVAGGMPGSSLGAPTTVENGTILLGYYYSVATLEYIGQGETTDRVINLFGDSGIVIDQSGAGLLKFTSDMISPRTGATLTLQGSTGGKGEFSGSVAGASNMVVKRGAGTWTLSGTNVYNGSTTIQAGTLRITGSCDNSNVTVGSTGTLAGGGSAKSVSVQAGGKIAPGSGVGTFHAVAGDVSLAGTAVYEWEYGSAGGDLVAVTGNLTLDNNWKLKLVDAGGTPHANQQYDLFTFTGSYLGSMAEFELANIDSSEVDWEVSNARIVVAADRVYITGLGVPVLEGDTNGDHVVDAADYIAVKQYLGLTGGASLAQGNVDGDDDVDWDDLQMVMTNFGSGSGTTPATTPEPATLGLLALGAMAILRRPRAA
jgi:autotransporter-associated beta strand protein